MKVTNLDHLNLSVADFDETVDWYHRVFGFDLVEKKTMDDGTVWGVIRCGDAMLCVYEHPERTHMSSDEMADSGVHGVAHFGLRITDRAAWEETIKRENIEVEYGGAVRWPHSHAWYITDPTGYEIEVVLWDDNQIRFD
ncbi:VOC family protein [bacterium]|nr:VOC family protein [bacterium]